MNMVKREKRGKKLDFFYGKKENLCGKELKKRVVVFHAKETCDEKTRHPKRPRRISKKKF